ncbi:MAG: hypothetical protein UU74_C0033G0013 [Candidatus Woesebacteria bacterium GW2011_GWA1_41_7]|uniref:Uncharacterized protein n=1 Tax=Candidatus Woesebacteria bacterium GW2011_GWA1_41_7 TaxID=1618556 RepID=A0A0G0Z3Y9_9BACT|nr:MAG: hypothetical protein UU74_C0033G0013 [Candidatus Woesebacteria bacterium GW2011_GWA1_41_7]
MANIMTPPQNAVKKKKKLGMEGTIQESDPSFKMPKLRTLDEIYTTYSKYERAKKGRK